MISIALCMCCLRMGSNDRPETNIDPLSLERLALAARREGVLGLHDTTLMLPGRWRFNQVHSPSHPLHVLIPWLLCGAWGLSLDGVRGCAYGCPCCCLFFTNICLCRSIVYVCCAAQGRLIELYERAVNDMPTHTYTTHIHTAYALKNRDAGADDETRQVILIYLQLCIVCVCMCVCACV